jgi:hypothetical protein
MKTEPVRFERPALPHAAVEAANWELDAALAVLQRAREELAALPVEHDSEMHLAAQRRVQSAQQLVNRICGKLP